MSDLFRLPRGLLAAVLERARHSPEREVCGLLAGPPGEAPARHIPITNIAARPDRFDMDPAELIDAFRAMRQAGEELIAIYHSHPFGPPAPSATDIAECQYPETVHLIVGMGEGSELEARAYRIRAGSVAGLGVVTEPR
jgi:proteasome lid subunit RPN8/RPN11